MCSTLSISPPQQSSKELIIALESTLPQWSSNNQDYLLKKVDLSFAVVAPKLWNKLPDSLQNTGDQNTFRRQLKIWLFDKQTFAL
jgi:hypothetical protein